MKKKLVTKTYLREALDYDIKIFYEEDYYVCIKKLNHLTRKFIITNDIVGMSDGYYIIEIIPKKGHQALRIFLDDKKNVIEYYFDVIKESGLDENKIPYFIDLYVDITKLFSGEINVLDEDELEEAYEKGIISKDDYNLANYTKNTILNELKTNTNKLMKIDLKKYLKSI